MTAGSAERLQELAVHVNDLGRARPLVEVVHVLRDEGDPTGKAALEPRQGLVGGVGPGLQAVRASGVVEGEDPGRIAPVALGCGDLLEVDPGPEPARVAEGAEARLGRDSRARQDEDVLRHRADAPRS